MSTPLPFTNKTIAITGAASGIGLTLSHHLASLGASLSLADLSPSLSTLAQKLSLEHSCPIIYRIVDVSSSSAVNAWIADTLEKFGRLDGAVNAAGINGPPPGNPAPKTIWETSDEEYAVINDVNAKGVFNCMRAQLRAMGCGRLEEKVESDTKPPGKGNGELGKRGAIVNVASIAGTTGRPGSAAYTGSKHAVVGLSRSAAKEAGAWGVRVNVVAPGYVDTKMMVYIQDEVERLCLPRVGKPEEVAGLITWLLGGDGSAYVTGEVYNINGGWIL